MPVQGQSGLHEYKGIYHLRDLSYGFSLKVDLTEGCGYSTNMYGRTERCRSLLRTLQTSYRKGGILLL